MSVPFPMLPMDNEMEKYLDFVAEINAHGKRISVVSNVRLPRLKHVDVDYLGQRNLDEVLQEHKNQPVVLFASFDPNNAITGSLFLLSKLVTSHPHIKSVCLVPVYPLSPENVHDYQALFLPALFPEYKEITARMEYILCKNDMATTLVDYCLLEPVVMEELLWKPTNLHYVWHEGQEINKQKKKKEQEEVVDEFERLGRAFEEERQEEVEEKTAKEIAQEKKRAKEQAAREKEAENAKYTLDLPGVHYIIKQIVTINATRQLEWVRRVDSVLSSKKKAFLENKDNLYLYDTVIKYILWEKDSDAFLTAPRKDFLAEQVYESACLYFSRYLDNHMSMLEKLMTLRQSNPKQTFYFPSQYAYQPDLFSYVDLSSEFSVLHSLFNVPKTAEFVAFNLHYLTPFVLGKALTYVVDQKIEYTNKRVAQNVPKEIVFNSFIHDQMRRFTLKLNPFLDMLHQSLHHDIMRQDVVTVMDAVFDCDFLKQSYVLLSDSRTALDLVKKNFPKLRPMLPAYLNEDESIFNLVYHYGLHAYQTIYSLMKSRVKNPTPRDVDLYMEAFRKNHWYKMPTQPSAMFPRQEIVSGLLCESFLEFSIACMDLQDAPLAPANLLPLLIPYVFEHHCEDLDAPYNKLSEFQVVRQAPMNARWITPELVYHMYKENDIHMSLDTAREFHTILINLFLMSKDKILYKTFIYKFIHQMSGKKNILPMERTEKEVFHAPNKMNRVLFRQRVLRKQDNLDDKLEDLEMRSQLEQLTLSVKRSVNDEERILAMNRANMLVAFYTNVAHPPLSNDYQVDKDVLNEYVKDASRLSNNKQQWEVYRLYQNRDLLVPTEEDVKDIMRLLTQLKAEEEPRNSSSIHRLLDSMEENNVLSIRLCYSILDQLNKRHITFTHEQLEFYEMMCEHIQWAMRTPKLAEYLFGDLALVKLILSKRSSLHRSIVENNEVDIFQPKE